VHKVAGFALRQAQAGEKHEDAVPMKAFGNAGVLEIRIDDDGDTYRAIYTVTLPDAVDVLHAFKKKSKKGKATTLRDINLVKKRLRDAEAISAERRGK
jgi:phage-related protein